VIEDDVIRSLTGALPDCTAEEIADVLWLASLLPGQQADAEQPGVDGGTQVAPKVSESSPSMPREGRPPWAERPEVTLAQGGAAAFGGRIVPATMVGLRAPATVNQRLSTARVLSLFKRIRGPGPPEVDIDATVAATADAQRLVVVTSPGRERGLDVALVVDSSPVMDVLGGDLAQFEAMLLRAGAFRSVTRWTLVPGPEVLIRDRAGVEHSPDRLVDPSGRRLVLLVTDAVADHWYARDTWQALRRWADVMPTAIIDVLPDHYRSYSALGGSAITMRSRRPGAPNRIADVAVDWWDREADRAARAEVPVPVAGLRPESLAVWAQAVAAGTAWVDAVWARQPPGRSARETNADLSAEDRFRAFEARASRGAQDLARILAGAPVLSWPLITVLQARLLPETSTSELAALPARTFKHGPTYWLPPSARASPPLKT
jgi:hypothetical protein